MKVLVTGAGGFLGRAVVDAATARGHDVLAMHRPASLPSPGDDSSVQILAGDLRQAGSWTRKLGDVDAVIHCAAAASGDLATQLAGTVLATENLLAALPSRLASFVHVSSFSVYDFAAGGRTLDETTPLEPEPLRRDAYTQTKLQQERMVRDWAREHKVPLLVARPGAIYGPGKDWDFGSAMRVGRFDLIFAPLAPMRLIHVSNCAAALVDAIEHDAPGETIVNLVDDEQPSHWRFHREAQQAGGSTGRAIPVPYLAVRAVGGLAILASRVFFAGRARLPEWLDPYRQRVRWRSLRYGNASYRRLTQFDPVSLDRGVATIIAPERRDEL